MILLLLAACSSGSIVLDDPDATDDSATPGDDTGVPEDTSPPESPFMGEYSGEVSLFMVEWDWDLCEGDVAYEVDAEGALGGGGTCLADFGRGGEYELPVDIVGAVDEDGAVTGTVTFEVPTGKEFESITADLEGQAEDDSLELSWTAELSFGGGGGGGGGGGPGGGETMTVEGSSSASLD